MPSPFSIGGGDVSSPLLTDDEEQALATRARAGDADARERLILANLPWVIRIARGFRSSGADPDDVISEGCRGLIQAVDRYEPGTGARVATYATPFIRNAIRTGLYLRGKHLIRVPLDLLPGKPGRDAATEIRREAADRIMGAAFLRFGDPDDGCVDPGRVADPSGAPAAERADSEDRAARVARLMADAGLDDRQALVIRRRFGLGGREPERLEAIAADLGVTKQRVQQIEAKAMHRLEGAAAGQPRPKRRAAALPHPGSANPGTSRRSIFLQGVSIGADAIGPRESARAS